MADGYVVPVGDATHPYPNSAEGWRRTESVGWPLTNTGIVRGGKRPGPGFEVSILTGPDRARVQPGRAIVVDPAAGQYKVALTSATDAAFGARPSSGTSRIDLVVLRVYDGGASGANTQLVKHEVELVKGAETASTPSVPDTSTLGGVEVIGQAAVPAVGAIVFTPRMRRTCPVGGITPVFDQTDRDTFAPFDGLTVFREDTNITETCTDPTTTPATWAPVDTYPTFTGTETPLIGATPPAGTRRLVREGSPLVTTDSGSLFTIDLAANAFPNALVSLQFTLSDSGQDIAYARIAGGSTLAKLVGQAVLRSGSGAASRNNVRVSFTAAGW